MKKRTILSILLSMVMATTGLLSIAGCSKITGGTKATKKKVVEIEEDTLWFNSERVNVGKNYKKELGLDYVYQSGDPVILNEGIMCYFDGMYPYELSDEEMMAMTDEEYNELYMSHRFCQLDCYAFDGTTLWTTDLTNICNPGEGYSVYIYGIKEIEDEYYVQVDVYDNETYTDEMTYFAIDTSTGEVSKTPISIDLEAEAPDINDGNCWLERQYIVEGNTVYCYYGYDNESESAYYKIAIKDNTGKVSVLDSREFLKGKNLWDVQGVANFNDTEALIFVSTDSDLNCLKIDFNTNKVEEYEFPEDLKGIEFYSLVNLDGKYYSRDKSGIYEIDFVDGSKNQVFSFSDCNINLYEIDMLNVSKISEDEVVMYGNIWGNISNDSEPIIYRFTKADTNPNAGKIVLEASNLGSYINETLGEAIYKFNNENEKYFISYNEDYVVNNSNIVYNNEEDYEKEYLSAQNELSKQLAMDLMNGEGPDIILNAASMQQLNNADYLVDLSSYAKDINDDDYFMNIVEACKIDDKLYQMPLTFYIDALYGPSGLSESGVGFTFDEYKDIVSEYCNGKNLMTLYNGRLNVFSQLLSSMTTPIVDSKGSVNLNSEEFLAICEYCKELSDKSYYDENTDEFSGSMAELDTGDFSTVYIGSAWSVVDSILSNANDKNKAFYGYPTYEGIGPTANIVSSAAIAASCANSDGAWEFIETLLSEDALSKSYELTISRNVLVDSIESQIESYNEEVDDNRKYYSEAEAHMYMIPYNYASIDDIGIVYDVIESINTANSIDTQMLQIIEEEIQPYFADQKTLDDVILIMEDKCQTVVDERG
ncbi:MAG: hypothetical protein MJ172_05760 [Clostridia bacterium]|nr:hypothetical protein [Clostridia bacterium]